MLKCSHCQKLLPPTKFAKNNSDKRGYQYNCKPCLKHIQAKKKNLLSKEDAVALMDAAIASGEEYTCRVCNTVGTADKYYYKVDRGNFYINNTECRECTKERMRYNSFGITRDEYNLMLSEQDNKCSICEIDMDEYVKTSQNNKVFSVDHCHTTGKIRGLLCCKCNRGLGYFKDNPDFLIRASNYLKGNDMV